MSSAVSSLSDSKTQLVFQGRMLDLLDMGADLDTRLTTVQYTELLDTLVVRHGDRCRVGVRMVTTWLALTQSIQ